jgi:Right handed beta helix region
MKHRWPLAGIGIAVALALPALAGAQTYPEPKDPGKVTPRPKGPFHTYTVCKRGCDFRKIQAAVNKAKAGDKVKIKSGTYREAVKVDARKSYLRIVGNPKSPRKVVLDGRNKGQNGIFVNGADEVTIDGVMARNYNGNGFFAVNVVGYTMNHLVAEKTGTYGLYAFNSKGGTMENSEAYYVNDGAFYIGQTPQQAKPIRSIVRNVDGWGAPIGFSGSNMRYVTITKSRFYNNAAGIIPNSIDSEKFPPEEDNVIVDNDLFWNNFNFHAGAPFKIRESGTAALAPVGTGIVLVGGHRTRIENNRIFGNYLSGVGMIEGILNAKNPQARTLVGNTITGNAFGLDGTDLNGHDLAYDGNGTGNCIANNTGIQATLPADGSTFATCPFGGANAFSQDVQNQLLAFTGAGGLNGWVRHPHAARPGFEPLELYKP